MISKNIYINSLEIHKISYTTPVCAGCLLYPDAPKCHILFKIYVIPMFTIINIDKKYYDYKKLL